MITQAVKAEIKILPHNNFFFKLMEYPNNKKAQMIFDIPNQKVEELKSI